MEQITLSTLANWVILLGGVAVAITNILKLFDKPSKVLEKRKRQKLQCELAELMPEVIKQEKIEIEKSVYDVVSKEINPRLDDMNGVLEKQTQQLNLLNTSSLDILRQNILYIYNHHKATKTLTESERDFLDNLYTDYSNEGGNSYIERLYNRMADWTVVDDE